MNRTCAAIVVLLACAHTAAIASTAASNPVPGAAVSESPVASASTDRPAAMDYAEKIRAFLLEQAAPYGGSAQINVEALAVDKLAACDQTEPFLPQGTRLRSRLSVGIRCVAPQSWVAYAQVNISIEGNYYVTAHALKAGTAISTENISQRSGDLLRLPNGSVLDPELLIGSVTTQRLAAGSTIKASALRSPESIQRGQAVRLEARGPGFVATSDGKAMQNGEPGSQIQVRTASGQMVSGTVLNSRTVIVLM